MTFGGLVARLGSAVRRVFERLFRRPAEPRPGLPGRSPARPETTDAELVPFDSAPADAVAPLRVSGAGQDERARAEAEARAQAEAAERARREAEARERAEAEERALLEAQERALLEAEERTRLEAEAEEARLEAEEAAARRQAEEAARLQAEEAARLAAEAAARAEAAELELREAEERERLAALEQERLDTEERVAREAEAEARREATDRERLEAEEQARLTAEAEARREDELDAEESRRVLEEAEQARFESEQAMTAEFSARLAETESLLEAGQARDERLFGEDVGPDEVVPQPEPGVQEPEPEATVADVVAPADDGPEELVVSPSEPAASDPAAPRVRAPVDIPSDYVPVAESEHALYRVDLEGFEGPLDLLLFLIRRHAIDVFDIPMAFVCERYLGYLKVMESLNIDVAAEFLAMAAELLHIKSKMLLPRPVEVEEEEEVDPRAELVRRLLEYQKYKDAADQLSSLNRTGRDTFGRDPEELPPAAEKAPLAEVGLFALIEAFDTVLKRQKPELRHQVMMETASVRQRIRSLIAVFTERHQVPFLELLGDLATRVDVVVTFLSILEMARLQMLKIYQSSEGAIYLEARFETAEQALDRLQGIDSTLDGIPPPSGEQV